MVYLKLKSQKLQACLEVRSKSFERNFYYFKYTNVAVKILTAPSMICTAFLHFLKIYNRQYPGCGRTFHQAFLIHFFSELFLIIVLISLPFMVLKNTSNDYQSIDR